MAERMTRMFKSPVFRGGRSSGGKGCTSTTTTLFFHSGWAWAIYLSATMVMSYNIILITTWNKNQANYTSLQQQLQMSMSVVRLSLPLAKTNTIHSL
jgi:hypothetical protein